MLWQDIQKIRSEAPLIHNITNYVVMNITANALLASGELLGSGQFSNKLPGCAIQYPGIGY